MPAIFAYARFPALDLWYTLWTVVAWETRIPAERRQYEVERKIVAWLGREKAA